MPKWSDFVSWAFFGLMAYFGYQLTSSVDRVSESIQELNVKMAVVVYQIQAQDKEMGRLDKRVERLEGKKVR